MTAYSIAVSKSAAKYLAKLSPESRARITAKLAELATWPNPRLDVRLLVGREAGDYRLRVGALRVLFFVDDATRIIAVTEIGPRGQVYDRSR